MAILCVETGHLSAQTLSWFYGELIGNGQDHFKLFIGYLISAAVMLIGGL